VVFHRQDVYLIPFGLFWGGFAIFWEYLAAGSLAYSAGHHSQKSDPQWFFVFWGIPFVLIGQYVMWGRFVYDAWLKKRTHYAVTDRRVLVVQDAWGRRMSAAYLDSVPAVHREHGPERIGSLLFGFPEPVRRDGWQIWNAMSIRRVPVFVDIEDVDEVYRLVAELREKSTAGHAR
jgi:hypothetical protein